MEGYQINIENARDLLMRGMRYFVGDRFEWLPEYEEIADWMTDNKGKGLLCLGDCGRGKTVICQKFLPVIFRNVLHFNYNVYDATQMLEYLEDINESWALCIDDVGSEDRFVVYGNEKRPFQNIIDHAEKNNHLLVVTSNAEFERLQERYGTRVIDRLVAITRLVVFKGKSYRI